MNDDVTNKAPDYLAYQVTELEEKGRWNEVGAAWNHADLKGLTVRLNSMPLNGEVVLRVNEPRQGQSEDISAAAQEGSEAAKAA